jgi:hypothetical protein
MENSDRYLINELNAKFKDIEQRLFEESQLKYPSISRLSHSASEIERYLDETEISRTDFLKWKSFRKRDLGIFREDLDGKLGHDYKNQLIRYRDKWFKEKTIIANLIDEFRSKFCIL